MPDEAQDTPQQPVTPPVETSTQPVGAPVGDSGLSVSPKKRKTGLIVGIIIAAAVLVLGGGSASAYFLWFQNPDKVLSDAVSNLLTAETVSFKSTIESNNQATNESYTIAVNGKFSQDLKSEFELKMTSDTPHQDFTLDGAVVSDSDGTLYGKVNNLPDLINQFAGEAVGSEYTIYFGNLIEMIDGKWIQISSKDLEQVSAEYSQQQTCFTDAIKKLQNDAAVKQELQDLFQANNFISAGDSLGSKDVAGVNSLGYVLVYDSAKALSFMHGMKHTQFGTSLEKCNESIDFSAITAEDLDDTGTDTVTKYEIWISQFNHQFTEISVGGTTKDAQVNLLFKPVFNETVETTIPTEFVTVQEIYDEYEATMKGLIE